MDRRAESTYADLVVRTVPTITSTLVRVPGRDTISKYANIVRRAGLARRAAVTRSTEGNALIPNTDEARGTLRSICRETCFGGFARAGIIDVDADTIDTGSAILAVWFALLGRATDRNAHSRKANIAGSAAWRAQARIFDLLTSSKNAQVVGRADHTALTAVQRITCNFYTCA